MQQINGSVINSMILGRNHFCCLCFKIVTDSAVHIEDKVIVKKNDNTFEEVYMFDILTNILGSEIDDQLSIFNAVCNKCSSEAIKSYKFLTKCNNNSKNLGHIIDSLSNGTEVLVANTNGFKAGFVSINKENFEYRGYKSNLTATTGLLACQQYKKLQYKNELRKKPAAKPIKKPGPVYKNKRNEKNKILCLRLVRLNPNVISKQSTVFVCPSCDKFFARRHSMHLHYRSKHIIMSDGDRDPFLKHQKIIHRNCVYLPNSIEPLMETNNRHSLVLKMEPEENDRRVPLILKRSKIPNILLSKKN